jgi:polyhydroxybutyrate depolymerase
MNIRRLYRMIIFLLISTLLLSSCRLGLRNRQSNSAPEKPSTETQPTSVPATPTSAVEALIFQTGRNDYTLKVDGTPRKFIVYIPAGYDPSHPTPLVFMFHGSNQNGQIMYESTGWAAKADAENIIVVFPYSWEYFVTEDNRMEEKWNSAGIYRIVPAGSDLKDDVRFVRVMLEQVKRTFNIEEKRIYASGFSNGGGFVISRLVLEMNDTFAAFATSGAAMLGEALPDQIPTGINASLYSVLGSNDEKISERAGVPLPFPIIAEEIANQPLFMQMNANATTALSLAPSYQVEYQKPTFTTMTFNQSLSGADNEYIFRMVNGMGHVYPSGDNNRARLNVADLFWEFFMKHPLK